MSYEKALKLIAEAAETAATELDLSGLDLTELPPEIGQLTQLETLILGKREDLEFDGRKYVPKSGANQLRTLPSEFGTLGQLKKLDMSGNPLGCIHLSVLQLQELTELLMVSTEIVEIPDSLAQLSHLTTLYLSSNQISTIPDSLAQLSHLTKLDLKNNKIEELPDWLEQMPKLNTLDVRRNQLFISPEVLGPANVWQDPGSIQEIFNYIRRIRSGDDRPLCEAKLLLVGQGSVGKTSLINRLLDRRFNPHQSQTDGLNVRDWTVLINGRDVHINVWDFGGQEIYHATHQFFLTKRSLYILVCNCRTSEEDNKIEYWLKLIQDFGGESPVIIVGNKSDEQPLDLNRRALRDKYPNIKAILETSCQDNRGIDDLRQAIIHEVSQLKEVYDPLPRSWFTVKEKLEHLDKDFITYNHYIGICATAGITEEQDQNQLIGLLHDLGLVLNFREHSLLQNTNVLNPDWVTRGIYALFSDDQLKTTNKGILTPADLSRVLDSERYPPDRHSYLTKLMKEFQLCFPLTDCPPDCPEQLLLPGLLPKEQPDNTNLDGDTLEFQYHYRILPQSILSRFICLMHEKIHDKIYWRSGVILAYQEHSQLYNRARIRADIEDKKIFITISGREQTRRVFLAIIRDTFTKIHSSFADPDITEWVPVPDHPDHPPLDYQELIGLEAMGEFSYPIGKLCTRVNIRQLLDGYEPREVRQPRHHGKDDLDMMRFEGKRRDWEPEPRRPRSETLPQPIQNNIYITQRQGTSPNNKETITPCPTLPTTSRAQPSATLPTKSKTMPVSKPTKP